jgi:hypothetical protein
MSMKLIAYSLGGTAFEIRAAPRERQWMSATTSQFAYRCLPLNIANAHGWEILCPAGFTAIWDGDAPSGAIRLRADDGEPPASSHFGHGVLTFDLPYLFRTEPNHDLFVTGPLNSPKDGICALSGVVETDWAPYTFTMNWLFTRRSKPVRFEKGEPICHFFPVPRGLLGEVQPELRQLSEARDLQSSYMAWATSRSKFNKQLESLPTKGEGHEWQKHYFRGRGPDDVPWVTLRSHQTTLRLKNFKQFPDEAP